MASRGPKWTPVECRMLCEAFIAASEDAADGTDQCSAEFQEKIHSKYKRLLSEYNRAHGSCYNERKAHSIFNQFKKLSRLVLKYKAVEDQAGVVPTGDNDRAVFLNKIKETFMKRHSKEVGNMIDQVLYSKDVLSDNPKWSDFEAELAKKNTKRKGRPEGSKKAKQLKEDIEKVKKVLSLSGEEQEKQRHRKKKEGFMDNMSGSLDVLTRTLADKNDQAILALCSPTTRSKYAAELMKERLKRMTLI